jgi:hypothetical protein
LPPSARLAKRKDISEIGERTRVEIDEVGPLGERGRFATDRVLVHGVGGHARILADPPISDCSGSTASRSGAES